MSSTEARYPTYTKFQNNNNNSNNTTSSNKSFINNSRFSAINSKLSSYVNSSSSLVSPPSSNNNSSNITDTESITSYETNNSTIATTINNNNNSPTEKSNNKIKRTFSFDEFSLDKSHDNYDYNSSYQLKKTDTRFSIDSYVVDKTNQFKIELNLKQSEIDLIRYTWNKMLLEENQSNNNLPGSYNIKKKPINSTTSSIATSLFCRQFYANLLSKDSNLEKLFPSIKHQAVSFAGVLNLTISQLENLSVLDEYFEKLGKRHSRILNIEPVNFELMGEALIQTFHERFGSIRFNQQLELLWIKLYLYMSNTILQFGIDPSLKLQRIESNNSSFQIDKNSSIFTFDNINNNQPQMINHTISNTSVPSEDQQSIKTSNHESTTTIKKSLLSNMLSSHSSISSKRISSDNSMKNNTSVSNEKTSKIPNKKFSKIKKGKDNCVIM
ncbi:unnamed protein product [Candida verbasci]|uniref:Globin domain-containing protein n=1 Tax=Candida verbasci TaxID=1227364 RepID=A0A9W4TVZ0_9ASCO|nr:unnamed protein product [Candida verbasci]